ncbi:hypothetical protein PMAYCL1PPCAC_32466, partial [Pristionchus mayeri]
IMDESSTTEKFPNLNADQLATVRGNIKKVTVQEGLTEQDFQKLLPHWGSFVSVAFMNLASNHGLENYRLPFSALVSQVNLLEGM